MLCTKTPKAQDTDTLHLLDSLDELLVSHAAEIVDMTPAREVDNMLIPYLPTLSENNASNQSVSATHAQEPGLVLVSKLFYRHISWLANEIDFVVPARELYLVNIPKPFNRSNTAGAIQNGRTLIALISN